MTHCIKCGRALKRPPVNGMGPKCAKAAKPTPAAVDLFGFRPEVFAQELADRELIAWAGLVAAARRRMGLDKLAGTCHA